MRLLNGRMNRAVYWLTLGLCAVLYAAMNIASSKPVAVSEVVLIFLAVPRLHDVGKSGWFALIGVLVELCGLVIGFSFFPLEQAKAVAGISVLIIVGLLIWLGCLRGDPGPNRWGDAPEPGISFKRRQRATDQGA